MQGYSRIEAVQAPAARLLTPRPMGGCGIVSAPSAACGPGMPSRLTALTGRRSGVLPAEEIVCQKSWLSVLFSALLCACRLTSRAGPITWCRNTLGVRLCPPVVVTSSGFIGRWGWHGTNYDSVFIQVLYRVRRTERSRPLACDISRAMVPGALPCSRAWAGPPPRTAFLCALVVRDCFICCEPHACKASPLALRLH